MYVKRLKGRFKRHMYMHVCILHIVLSCSETAGDGQVMGGDIKWCLYIDIVPSLGGLNEVIIIQKHVTTFRN